MIIETIALIFLGLGADMAIETSINGDKGRTISGSSYVDCKAGDKTQCNLSDAYDLVLPLYVVDTAQYALFGDFDLIGKPHTEGRAEHEARHWKPEASYGGSKYKYAIQKRR
jgi:hypothetical protein